MTILAAVSSRVGDRTEAANRAVAARCLAEPALLEEIAAGLGCDDAALVGDCAEVMTKVAEGRPDLAAPYAETLARLFGHPTTRVRWEAMHALALVAALKPEVIGGLLPELARMVNHDRSRIVRDHVVVAVGRFGATDRARALVAYPVLRLALTVWNGTQASRALDGLAALAGQLPERHGELLEIARAYQDDGRAVVRRAARRLLRAIESV